jgi:hypothetical protein
MPTIHNPEKSYYWAWHELLKGVFLLGLYGRFIKRAILNTEGLPLCNAGGNL